MTIQIHVSKALAVDLKPHLAKAPIDLRAMQWYGHRIQVLRRKCVILMELRSRYAVVFTGLTKPDFARFPEIFRDRLLREALVLSQLDEARTERLTGLVGLVAENVEIMPGSDRSVQAHINDVVWHLELMAREIGSLPEDAWQEFNFGLRANQMPRTCKGEKEYFIPLEVMRGFWLGLLEHGVPRPDNVVPFRKR